MSGRRERHDLLAADAEEEAARSQDDSTDVEGEEGRRQRRKTSGVSRKSNLTALTGNPSKLDKKQQLSILLSLLQLSKSVEFLEIGALQQMLWP